MSGPRVKGRAVLDAVAVVRDKHGPAGVDAVVAKLPPAVQEVLRGSILANEWYPLDAMTSFMTAGNHLYNGGDEGVILARSERVVEQQLGGIYRIFVRFGSPEFIIKRLNAFTQTYFDGVQVDPRFDGERRAIVRYTGFRPEHRIIEPAVIGFYRKALELSGAKDVSAKVTTPLAAGKGYLEVSIAWS
ncbi:MAG TPA: hypothetical protein VEB43_19815 [Anaeromyxobacter sp.]|nr:hypothetical protein [Anaeromyxobacter sp.]